MWSSSNLQTRISLGDIPARGMTVVVDEAPRLLLRSDPNDHGLTIPELARGVCRWIASDLHRRNKVIEMEVVYRCDKVRDTRKVFLGQ